MSQALTDSIKVVVVGEPGVGKTAIIHRFTEGNFTDDFKATVGADFSSHYIDLSSSVTSVTPRAGGGGGGGGGVSEGQTSTTTTSPSSSPSNHNNKSAAPNGNRVQLHIWDTAGQERYRSLSLSYFKGCEAAMVVFDVNSLASYQRVPYWIDEVLKGIGRRSLEGFPLFVVGNKVDTAAASQAVTTDVASREMRERGLPYMTCSAKTGQHVLSVFRALTSAALDTREVLRATQAPIDRGGALKLSSSSLDSGKKRGSANDNDCC